MLKKTLIKILTFTGFWLTESDLKIHKALMNSKYKTMRVGRKGSVHVEAYEVYQTDSHRDALEKAHRIVENSRRRK